VARLDFEKELYEVKLVMSNHSTRICSIEGEQTKLTKRIDKGIMLTFGVLITTIGTLVTIVFEMVTSA